MSFSEECVLYHRQGKDLVTLWIISVVLFSSIIVHVGFCVYHIRTRVSKHGNVLEDHDYHTYDEIRTLSYRIVRNLFSSEINDNQFQNLTQHVIGILADSNLQSTNGGSNELSADFPDEELHQEVPRQSRYIDDMNLSETDSSQIPLTSILNMANNSDGGISNNVNVGNVGDENQYETVLQDRSEIHPYTEINGESQNSIISTDSIMNNEQRQETDSTKEPFYINLQF